MIDFDKKNLNRNDTGRHVATVRPRLQETRPPTAATLRPNALNQGCKMTGFRFIALLQLIVNQTRGRNSSRTIFPFFTV